ncbi:MAG TPA: BadF/BadG/BcrA/BcrD ATPase family protein [Ktedonobacterales bacterium]|jgi:N-acetylglucosamine kinase-like BadF-type ATPase|nr:BadF/BadG/BcrA/BcrD ATPase family protein [Ktedonobacterales bacterium]
MRYVVGVDGGGTKTAATVLGEDLGAVASATSGPANHRSVGMEEASANIATAITTALRSVNVPLESVAAICMCLSGFDTDLDLPVPQGTVRQLGYSGTAIFENDVVGAWAGATGGQAGLVVIAGTGSTGLGMNEQGRLWRTDGWDYLLGDAGSGYDIGRKGIRAVMQALDGRAGPTLLARELKAAYGVEDAEAMRRLWDSTTFGKFEVAAFAQRVSAMADEGDVTARDILSQAGQDLGRQGAAIVAKLGMGDAAFPVSTVGSVFKSGQWVTEPFRRLIAQAAPRATFRAPLHAPEVGAAILALRRLRDGDTGSWTLGTGQRRIQRSLRIDEIAHV